MTSVTWNWRTWRADMISRRTTRCGPVACPFGLDHNETRSWHGWHRHTAPVMLAFAMMAAIRHRANAAAVAPKRSRAIRLSRPSTSSVDRSRTSAGSRRAWSAPHSTRRYDRVVTTATGTSSRCQSRPHQKKNATVMLERQPTNRDHPSDKDARLHGEARADSVHSGSYPAAVK